MPTEKSPHLGYRLAPEPWIRQKKRLIKNVNSNIYSSRMLHHPMTFAKLGQPICKWLLLNWFLLLLPWRQKKQTQVFLFQLMSEPESVYVFSSFFNWKPWYPIPGNILSIINSHKISDCFRISIFEYGKLSMRMSFINIAKTNLRLLNRNNNFLFVISHCNNLLVVNDLKLHHTELWDNISGKIILELKIVKALGTRCLQSNLFHNSGTWSSEVAYTMCCPEIRTWEISHLLPPYCLHDGVLSITETRIPSRLRKSGGKESTYV